MSRRQMLHDCERSVQALLPELPRPEGKALAALVLGIVLAVRVGLGSAAAAAPGAATDRSKQRRVQRLLANDRFDVARAQRRLLARIVRHGGRLDLLLDATTTGATAAFPGVVTLMLAVGWHGRALPLAWRCWRADEPGQDWTAATRALFDAVAAALPADAQAVVLADRGLSGANLARAAAERGWHFLLRVQRATRLRLADGAVVPIGDLAPRAGAAAARIAGARVYAPRTKGTAWTSHWDRALVANAVAVWPRGAAEPWLLVTDLPPTRARCREYRHRTWEEALFRDLKSFGWGWDKSRLRAPERVARLVLALALATLWVAATAQRVVKHGRRRLVDDRSRRTLSYFQIGHRFILRLLANDTPAPCLLHLWRDPRPPTKLS
jgi:hypothetical protein